MNSTIFNRSLASKATRFVPTTGSYPVGYAVGGAHCGVKKGLALDLALLRNTASTEANAAAVFTKNKFKAAPILVSKKVLERTGGHNINLIIVNSGNANAVTGEKGFQDAMAMAQAADPSAEPPCALVMSTGVIGQNLPIDKIVLGVPRLAQALGGDHDHWLQCAQAISTTDTFPKLASAKFSANGTEYSIAGVAKGAGMICPNMATMLSFMATDAPISPAALDKILGHASDRSFNCISVDGDMLTNDTVVAIANGAAGGAQITETDGGFAAAQDAFTSLAKSLAQLVVRDGEGATKFIEITVVNARSYEVASQVARAVGNLMLVKTAMFGEDANWGRIVCAIGYAPGPATSDIIPSEVLVQFVPQDGSEPLLVFSRGEPQNVDEARALDILKSEEINIKISLGNGTQLASFWTCDLSHEYVTINGDYRS